MKTNFWLLFGAMVSTTLLAQQVTNPPPAGLIQDTPAAVEAPAAEAPAPKPAPEQKATKKNAEKKAAAKKAAAEVRSEPLKPGTAVLVASNVNVRAQAKLNSEIVTRLTKGQTVTVLEEIVLKNSAADEPSAWAKIVLPEGVSVWVHSSFIGGTNNEVLPNRLNMRAGPGENYSILGRLDRGQAVKEISTRGNWMEIEGPTNAYAFMAAQYLKQEASEPAPVVAPVEPEPDPTPATVTEPPVVAAVPTDEPMPVQPGDTNLLTEAPPMTEQPAETETAEPVEEEPLPPRIVSREGLVRGTASIQAPTDFALISPVTGKTINYLYTTSPHLDLQRYKGLRIVVTGEEGLDPRWRNTPVITIQKIQVIE